MVKIKFITFFMAVFVCMNLFAQSETLADPTAPLNFQPAKTTPKKASRHALPTLQSIVVTQGKRQAVINNKAYKKGQRVSGYQITHIDTEKVLLEYQQKTYTLTLYSPSESFSH